MLMKLEKASVVRPENLQMEGSLASVGPVCGYPFSGSGVKIARMTTDIVCSSKVASLQNLVVPALANPET
ncbi:hypothetical protein FGO68_gene11149 [Halteria grandinella]|uniref:Uncharacterized protein n=1 Tax=Halteria grandinella TaxID=5974 RepID=A0A8J8N9B7_HALGN|nr:hypothetical protein FGO68_gene11149 [Halteria grandinella]